MRPSVPQIQSIPVKIQTKPCDDAEILTLNAKFEHCGDSDMVCPLRRVDDKESDMNDLRQALH